MKIHILDNNVVINSVLANSMEEAQSLFPQMALIDADIYGGGIGSVWDGQQFIPAPPTPEPVPEIITPRQCRLQLLAMELMDDVEAAIDTMGQAAKIEWEYALEVKRTYTLVAAMQSLFHWSDAEMDTFFVEADKL